MSNEEPPVCDLCGDGGKMYIHGKCHITAPFFGEYDPATGDLLLACYVCKKAVARFKVLELPS